MSGRSRAVEQEGECLSAMPQSPKTAVQQQLPMRLVHAAIATTGLLCLCGHSPSPASARTFFDTDVYGDKELKIATVNKLKQKLRNAILKDPSVAPGFLKLAILDALGYNKANEEGGADASIAYTLYGLEMSAKASKQALSPSEKELLHALEVASLVKKDLQRTNTLSLADVIAFAGGQALESFGCGRVTVQIGRFDMVKPKSNDELEKLPINWDSPRLEDAIQAFERSGFSKQDALLLLVSIGEINRIAREDVRNESEEEDLEDDQPFVPVTFGSRDQIFGEKIGEADFSTAYLQDLLSSKKVTDALDGWLVGEPMAKSVLAKYFGNQANFRKDVAALYLKLTSVGESYTTRNS
eukprot:gene8510-9382_t